MEDLGILVWIAMVGLAMLTGGGKRKKAAEAQKRHREQVAKARAEAQARLGAGEREGSPLAAASDGGDEGAETLLPDDLWAEIQRLARGEQSELNDPDPEAHQPGRHSAPDDVPPMPERPRERVRSGFYRPPARSKAEPPPPPSGGVDREGGTGLVRRPSSLPAAGVGRELAPARGTDDALEPAAATPAVATDLPVRKTHREGVGHRTDGITHSRPPSHRRGALGLDRKALRHAFVLQEILGTPVSLRPDSLGGLSEDHL